MKKLIAFPLIILALAGTMASCKKNKNGTTEPDPTPTPTPAPAQRVVKYEITGNYTGKMNVVYTNASGATESVSDIVMPWSKEVTITKTGAVSVGFSAGMQGGPGATGVQGQTGTIRLYANGVEKQNASQTADSQGIMTFGALAYVFY